MRLWLGEELAHQMVRMAYDSMPDEVCGILAGYGQHITEVIPVRNSAAQPRYQYRLDDRDYVSAVFDLHKRGLDLIGFYHSHPDGDSIPSSDDIRSAAYPDAAYLIVGLRHRPALAAWRIAAYRIEPVELIIGVPDAAALSEDSSLSPAQRSAVLISALVAFVLMIALSLSLLPPAPVIPSP